MSLENSLRRRLADFFRGQPGWKNPKQGRIVPSFQHIVIYNIITKNLFLFFIAVFAF
jgi:hypothetical protein